mmetsp:Transcript_27876/g.55879  ORF Transcript_27876/g.55879 Transcript_27876/m.55879 type:complete len:209 (-) Transcript_27876:761-1387(-)
MDLHGHTHGRLVWPPRRGRRGCRGGARPRFQQIRRLRRPRAPRRPGGGAPTIGRRMGRAVHGPPPPPILLHRRRLRRGWGGRPAPPFFVRPASRREGPARAPPRGRGAVRYGGHLRRQGRRAIARCRVGVRRREARRLRSDRGARDRKQRRGFNVGLWSARPGRWADDAEGQRGAKRTVAQRVGDATAAVGGSDGRRHACEDRNRILR